MPSNTKAANVLLWTLQVLLAALFTFAGVVKLTMPIQTLAQQTGLPGALMRFVSVAEVAGALGLVLPGLLRIKRGLTPIAAACLIVVMVVATVLTAAKQGLVLALFPAAVGLLLGVVVRTRRQWI